MTSTVRFDPDTRSWYFGGERRRDDGAYALVIKRMDLAVAGATDLARALRQARQHELCPDEVIVDAAPDDQYSPKETVGGPIAYRLKDDGKLLVELTFSNDTYADDPAEFEDALRPLITPYLQRSHAAVHSIEPDSNWSMAPFFHTVSLLVPTRTRSLLDLYKVADELAHLIEAVETGSLTRETVVDLVLGQHAHLLIGHPEGPWLDGQVGAL